MKKGKQTKKKTVLYDATLLTNIQFKNAGRSGIFFVVYNLFTELLDRPEITLKLYCHPSYISQLQQVLDEHFKGRGAPEILNQTQQDYFRSKKGYFIQKKHEHRDKNEKLKKYLSHYLAQCFGVLSLFSFSRNRWLEKLKDTDAFISVSNSPVPKEIADMRNIKKYTVLYDTIPLIFPEHFPEMKNKNFSYRRLIESLNPEDYYFAISESTKTDYIKYVPAINPAHVTVIDISTNFDFSPVTDAGEKAAVRKKYNIPEGKKYMLSLCTLEPRKNLIFAVENFINFIKKNKIEDLVFVLGGMPWDLYRDKFNSFIDSLGSYKDKVILAGYIADEDAAALYSGAEFFVYPSLYEGFGMPILEAMKCATPVICSNTSSMPGVIGDAGLTIDPQSNEQMQAALEKMYYDGALRKHYSEKGPERARLFSWKKAVDVMLKEINSDYE